MEKRMISLFTLFCFCFGALMVRVADINFGGYYFAGVGYSTKTVIIGISRGKIYDRNLDLLTDSQYKLIAAVTPVADSAEYLNFISDLDSFDDNFTNGMPFAAEIDTEINNSFIRTFAVPERYTEKQTAVHLIGYLAADGESGVSGLERAYNDYFRQNSGTLSVSFEVDAKGRTLAGMDKKSTCYPSRQSCFRFVTSIKKYLYRINHTGICRIDHI